MGVRLRTPGEALLRILTPSDGANVDRARQRMVWRVRAAVRNRLLLANIAGGIVVLALVQLTLRESIAPRTSLWVMAAAATGWFVGLAILANIWAYLAFARSVAWVVERRQPTSAERAEVLRLPWQSALRPLVFWAFSAVVYAAVALTVGEASPEPVSKVVYAMLVGGIVTSALGFLLIERCFTELFTVTLAGRPPRRPATLGVRMRLLLAWGVGSTIPLLVIAVDSLWTEEMPSSAVAVLALGGLGAGLLATLASAHSLAEPLDNVRDALGRVRDGDLDTDLVVDDGGEIGQVQAGFNQMVKGLQDRERMRDLFGRHVGQAVVGHALERGTGLGGELRDASVVFVDIVGSTGLAEALPPDEVMKLLNDFFDVVVRVVDGEGGWVNKFEGDGALCIFGVPSPVADHATRALRATRQLHQAIQELARCHPGLDAGIGVSSGPVVAGNVGAEARFEYTVIGSTVNEAARLTSLAKERSIKVLATQAAVDRAEAEAEHWEGGGSVTLRGQTQPIQISAPIRSWAETKPA